MVPFLVSFALVVLTAVPTRLPGFAQIAPSWPMMGIFYWSIYRPDLMPFWVAFLIGVLADIVADTPLGISSLIFLMIRGIVVNQRRFFLTNAFPMSWAAFAVIAIGAIGLNWVLFAMLQGHAVDPQILLWQYVLLMGLFPLVTVIMAYTQMVLLKDV
jgi:rod shape-determining protein MreD